MWIMRIGLILLTLVGIIGCIPKNYYNTIVEINTVPTSSGVAKIKQMSGETKRVENQNCNLPCPLKVEKDNNYEVSLDVLGYYPVVIQLDWSMAVNTSHILDKGKTADGINRVPLVIPLVSKRQAQTILNKQETDKKEN